MLANTELGHEAAAVRVGRAVDAGGHAAGEEALGDLDQLDHRLAQAADGAGVGKAVGLAHQRAGADQQARRRSRPPRAAMQLCRWCVAWQ